MTNEQLQAYWDANPQALQDAIAANPSAFGITAPTGMMSSGMTLEELNAQNQAYNATNAMPAGFTPPPVFNEQGVPLYQTGGGFGPASQAAGYSLNQAFANPSQDFNEYLTSGTQQQQDTRTNTFDLGGVSLVRPDGT